MNEMEHGNSDETLIACDVEYGQKKEIESK